MTDIDTAVERALSALRDTWSCTASDATLRTILGELAQTVERDAIANAKTIAQVAEIYDREPSQIGVIRRRRKIGTKVGDMWLFTAAEVERLRPGERGKPYRPDA